MIKLSFSGCQSKESRGFQNYYRIMGCRFEITSWWVKPLYNYNNNGNERYCFDKHSSKENVPPEAHAFGFHTNTTTGEHWVCKSTSSINARKTIWKSNSKCEALPRRYTNTNLKILLFHVKNKNKIIWTLHPDQWPQEGEAYRCLVHYTTP